MKIHLTQYKEMAPRHATRVETGLRPDFNQVLGKAVQDVSDSEFYYMMGKLVCFYEHAEGSAIYFWIGE
jgi:hypothetical protein